MMWKGRVAKYIQDKLSENGFLHASLIDPDKTRGDVAETIGSMMREAGTDLFLVGGSMGVTEEVVDNVVEGLSKAGLPIVLFPGNISGLSRKADAILFMSLLNSINPYYIIGAQMQAAPLVKKYGLEVLPTGYLIIGYGGAAAHVGYATPIPWDMEDVAGAYALAATFLGMRYIYLEAGSGSPQVVPPKMVSHVKKVTEGAAVIITGGGVKSPEVALELVKSGADIVVTGTILERDMDSAVTLVKSIKRR